MLPPSRVLKIPASPSVSSHLEKIDAEKIRLEAALMAIPAASPTDCATAIAQRSRGCKDNAFNNQMPQSKWRNRATGLRR
jgi:hypothetical protein